MWVNGELISHYYGWDSTADEEDIYESEYQDRFGTGFRVWFERRMQCQLLRAKPDYAWSVLERELMPELDESEAWLLHVKWHDGQAYAKVGPLPTMAQATKFAARTMGLTIRRVRSISSEKKRSEPRTDTGTRKITIRRTKGNCGAGRTVILTNDAYKAVLRLVDRASLLGSTAPDHFLFPYKIRLGIGYDPTKPMKGWRTAWRKLTKAAGLPGFRFHDLRHCFITNHAEIGTPLPVVMAQAGHLSKRMTELYRHISNRALEEAAERHEQRKAEAMEAAKRKLQEQADPDVRSAVN